MRIARFDAHQIYKNLVIQFMRRCKLLAAKLFYIWYLHVRSVFLISLDYLYLYLIIKRKNFFSSYFLSTSFFHSTKRSTRLLFLHLIIKRNLFQRRHSLRLFLPNLTPPPATFVASHCDSILINRWSLPVQFQTRRATVVNLVLEVAPFSVLPADGYLLPLVS